MSIERILVIDDEQLIRDFIAETLRRQKYEVECAECGIEGVQKFKQSPFDLVFTDMKMPDITGIEVLKQIKEIDVSVPVIVITAYGSIENAVEAMRVGAFNYLIKPFSPETIEAVMNRVETHLRLVRENTFLKSEISKGLSGTPFCVIAQSPEMRQIMSDVKRIAQSNASVFITGESGTGKEVVAQAIHEYSLRKNRPFIRVNCAAIPETLIESEFFGHEKGAFTGANEKRLGRFELANGGTLMLDEVTEIPLTVQAKLLRAIQEQIFERVGGTKSIRVDVRMIATSNRDIKEALAHKILREDLYYRLNVVPIELPPLRKRRSDIIPLAEYFLDKLSKANHKESPVFSGAAKNKILGYDWPGNVRELANIVERSVVMSQGELIGPDLLFIDSPVKDTGEVSNDRTTLQLPIGCSLKELEKMMIVETLQVNENNRKKTAEILGITARTLRNKIAEYDL